MIKFFSKSEQRRFKPAPPPLPPRVWSEGPIHEQAKCTFLTRLPAEIRNEIYSWVFRSPGCDSEELRRAEEAELEAWLQPSISLDRRKSQETGTAQQSTSDRSGEGKKEHPLSLLLTCRKINQEATLLAFSTHTFVTSKNTSTFHSLRHRTSPLSPFQLGAISSLAHDLSEAHTYAFHSGGSFIANSLLLFPNLNNMELRKKRGGPIDTSLVHAQHTYFAEEDEKKERVPTWFHTTIDNVVRGRSFSWQKGQKWSVEWPLEESGACGFIEALFAISGAEDAASAMKDVDGIEPCACGCGKPSWLAAELVQETGRRVSLKVVYYGNAQLDRIRELRAHRIKLIPGAEPLPLTSLGGDSAGFGWDGEPNYWREAKGRNQGFLRRTLWAWAEWEEEVEHVPSCRIKLVPGSEPLELTSLGGDAAGFGWDADPKYWREVKERNQGVLGRLWRLRARKEVEQMPVVMSSDVKGEALAVESDGKAEGRHDSAWGANGKTYVGMSAGREEPAWWRDYWEMRDD